MLFDIQNAQPLNLTQHIVLKCFTMELGSATIF